LLSSGAARVGEHFGIKRVPVIKKQSISAYDPRVIEVTGISMMSTAQGADHTTGNIPTHECDGKSTEELVGESMNVQMLCAAADSVGLCLFGRTVTNINLDMIMSAVNSAVGTELTDSYFKQIGLETLMLEDAFNRDAGFTVADDQLPDFFYEEALAPTKKRARHQAEEVTKHRSAWVEQASAEMAIKPLPENSVY
jgi:aldehyde:ferredoxin oxidoreductase